MAKKLFGKTKNGEEVYIYELTNSKGMKAGILNFGAIIQSLYVPDKDGKTADVVLGYDKVSDYEINGSFFGCVIAPSANRIDKAKFTIDGVEYNIDVNDGPNNLHSHMQLASHKRIWDVKEDGNSLILSLKIADMDMGFPGNKEISITYTLTEDNELILHYTGKSDKNTIINPTNHSYFNLSGHDSGKNIESDVLKLYASKYTPVYPGAIPTGEIATVKGTVMDFTEGKKVSRNIRDDEEQLLLVQGYDHNFAVDGYNGEVNLIAEVEDTDAGRGMEVYSNLPGVQFYAGNCIDTTTGKGGNVYGKRSGLCLETQYFPDAIHHDNFEAPVFGPGKNYDSTTIYKFV